VLARIIEPTSKLDSLRVLEEVGVDPPAYRTLVRRLPVFAEASWRKGARCGLCRPRGPGAGGYSWAEIGARLGISRQAAQQRWGTS
jgi:hypothetical protein